MLNKTFIYPPQKRVIRTLEDLRIGGMTVICTIHQPSSKIFSVFSHLMLMSQGEITFLDKREEAINYFAALNRPVPPLYNPADHFLDIHDHYEAANRDLIAESIILHRKERLYSNKI